MPLSVRSAMTAHVTLKASMNLHEAMIRLGYTPIGVVVEQRRIRGVVLRADVDLALERHGAAVSKNPFLTEPEIASVVRESVVLVGPETPLCRVATQLQANRMPAFPVVDGPNIVGVVSLHSALAQLRHLWRWSPGLAA